MKQQESNLFDKGMSLDTNPIAMDNHTLSGALNATMITMNGNELVLLNDMGNARVEYAYLPDGYVPVGMKEHGGIVYVASYNPIRGESLIGSFPSPERNISNDEIGASSIKFNNLDLFIKGTNRDYPVTITTDKIQVLIPSLSGSDKKHIFRPGDLIKFSGSFDPLLSYGYSVKAVIVDSDNNSVDVTSSLLPSGQPDDTFHYYDGKISGELFLVGKLNLEGDTIDVNITASDNGNTRTVTVTPHLLNENGEIVSGALFRINGDSDVTSKEFTYNKVDGQFSGILTYEIYLQKTYGYIESISRKGSIDISKIGTGIVDFNYFYYYNNIQRELIEFDYDINCYFSDSQFLSRCYLKLWEYNSPSNYFTVELPLSSSFGSFSTLIPYGTGNPSTNGGESLPAIGKIYIGLLCVDRGDSPAHIETLICPLYFCIITSSVTNEYYMNNASNSDKPFMTLLETNSEDVIEIPMKYNIDWNTNVNNVRESITPIKYGNPVTVQDNSSNIITGDNLNSITSCFFGKQLVNNTTFSIKPKITVKYEDGSFPLSGREDISFTLADNSFSDSYTLEINWLTNQSDDSNPLGNKIDDITDDSGTINVSSDNVYPSNIYSNIINLKLNPSVSDGQINLTYRSVLNSLFYGRLGDIETYSSNDISAFVPFINKSDYSSLSQLLGTDAVEKTENNVTYYQPDSWFCFETWEGSKNARERKIMVMHAIEWYDHIVGNSSFNSVGQGEYSDDGSYGLFQTTSTNANWRFYTETLLNYVHESIRTYPSLIFWQGNNDDDSSIDYSGGRTLDFVIPMMFSSSGEMYVLNWVGTVGTTHPLNTILELYSKLYAIQDGQSVQFSYKRINDFLYNDTYEMKVNIALQLNVSLTYTDYPEYVTLDGTNYYLPKFILQDNTPSLTFDFSVTSPDISSDAEEYINAEPTLDTCALILSGLNITIKTQAVGLNDELLPLNSSHIYWYDNDTFYDATERNITGCIASNFHKSKKYLVIQKDANGNDNNVIYINKSKVGNILEANNATPVPAAIINSGDEKATKISDIATRHIIKNLFNG